VRNKRLGLKPIASLQRLNEKFNAGEIDLLMTVNETGRKN
jgi:hypothetical protein